MPISTRPWDGATQRWAQFCLRLDHSRPQRLARLIEAADHLSSERNGAHPGLPSRASALRGEDAKNVQPKYHDAAQQRHIGFG
jgi:hypothetical protein